MKVKKFTARTFSEALELVKKELSQDAVILQTEEKKGLRPQVEVTAAVDDDEETGENNQVQRSELEVRSEQRRPQPAKVFRPISADFQPWPNPYAKAAKPVISADRRETAAEPRRQAAPEAVSRKQEVRTQHSELRTPNSELRTVEGLQSEISGLRDMIEGLKSSGYGLALPAKKRAMMNFLLERSVREEYALRLCDRTTDMGELPLMLSADIKIKRHPGTRKAVMLIGPTGVGKTTTIAKLAAQAVKAGKKASIISLDTYRIGAAEQSRIYARILGIPLIVATNEAEFREGLARLGESRDVVFIDTTGRNPKDEAYLRSLGGLCRAAAPLPLELHLLMSAGGDDECMIEAYRSYRDLPIDYIAFTKIDEAVRYGSLYNLILTYQKPVAYITTGQRVPGDLEYATVGRLAGLITSKECHQC